jgi:hypothetical protein
VIDNMIFDKIAAEPGLADRLQALTAEAQIELLVTSDQEQECRDSEKPELVAILEAIPVRVIGSAPFVLDHSRLGLDRLGPPEPYDTLRKQAPSPRHTKDRLGTTTSHLERVPFVTEEKRLHGYTAQQPGITIWWWKDLREHIDAL